MRDFRSTLVAAAVVILTVTSCGGGGVKVAAVAADDAARATGRTSQQIELNGTQVSELAVAGNVSDDMIRDVAPQLDSQPIWKRSLQHVRAFDSWTEGQVRAVAIDVACDFFKGEIADWNEFAEELADKLLAQLGDMALDLSDEQLGSVVDTTLEFQQDLNDAWNSGSEQDRAAVMVACYTLDVVS